MALIYLQVKGTGKWLLGSCKSHIWSSGTKSKHHSLLMYSRSPAAVLWGIGCELDAPSQNSGLRGFCKSVCGLFQVSLHPPANAPPNCCQLQVKELSPPSYIQKIPALMGEEEKGKFARGKACSWRKSSQMWNLMLRSACRAAVGSSTTNPTRAGLFVPLLGNS